MTGSKYFKRFSLPLFDSIISEATIKWNKQTDIIHALNYFLLKYRKDPGLQKRRPGCKEGSIFRGLMAILASAFLTEDVGRVES